MGKNAAVKWWGLHGYDHPVGLYGLCASSRHNPTPKQQWLGSAWVKMSVCVCGTHTRHSDPSMAWELCVDADPKGGACGGGDVMMSNHPPTPSTLAGHIPLELMGHHHHDVPCCSLWAVIVAHQLLSRT